MSDDETARMTRRTVSGRLVALEYRQRDHHRRLESLEVRELSQDQQLRDGALRMQAIEGHLAIIVWLAKAVVAPMLATIAVAMLAGAAGLWMLVLGGK
jgi:hypothetical protein